MGAMVDEASIKESLIDAAINANYFIEQENLEEAFIEVGPGNCLSALFVMQYNKKIRNIYCIEGSAQHYWYQMMFWSFLSSIDSKYTYLPYILKSEANAYAKLDNSGLTIKHIPLWRIDYLENTVNKLPIMANRVLDQVCAHDFKLLVNSPFYSNTSGIVARGGLCRDRIHDLYLYGYGTYHGIDVKKYHETLGFSTELKIVDGELSAVFRKFGAANIEYKNSIQYLSQELSRNLSGEKPEKIWLDDDFPYAEDFRYLEEIYSESYSDSLSTSPLPLMSLKRRGLDDLVLNTGEKILILSARSAEIYKKINKMVPEKLKITTVSTLITILEVI